MSKKYYCDYCDKSMVATPSIIKTHIKGILHQKLVNEHYNQFKDPETILKEESTKNPCTRFQKGECQFGAVCRYSHYTQEQMHQLRELVSSKHRQTHNQPSFEDLYQKLQDDKCTKLTKDKNTEIIDPNGVTHLFPWIYNDALKNYGDQLPPSIREIQASDFEKPVYITNWG